MNQVNKMEECTKCWSCEIVELPFSSDPGGLRPDYFCGDCNTRFGTAKNGNFIVSEPANTSELTREISNLKSIIKTLLRIED